MTCEQLEPLLVEYVEGELPADSASAIDAHVKSCACCRAALRETRELLGDLSFACELDESSDATIGDRSGDRPAPSADVPKRLGDFEIVEELGRGGMGVVYRARQITLNRIVALKVLGGGLVESEKAVARFEREAQAAARLHHTNIVPVYAQGAVEGQFFYAMELIEGPSLARILNEWRSTHRGKTPSAPSVSVSGTTDSAAISVSASRDGTGRRSRRDFKRLAAQFAAVAEALHHAHESGVIHRDIKPHNLLLGRDGQFHITDFGLARLVNEPGITLSSDVLGTPAYMAPEQVDSLRGAIDARTDVYALGVTFYEALALERPFTGDSYEQVIHRLLNKEPQRPRRCDPRIPLDLETICLRAIEKEPPRRFPSAAALARDLRRYSEDYPIESRRVGPLGRINRWRRRHPAQATVIALALVIALLGPAAWWTARNNAVRRVTSAWETLLADYHDADRADRELGWIGRWFGDGDRLAMIDATRAVLTDESHTVTLLRDACAAGDADALYLCAWAKRRAARHDPSEWSAARDFLNRGDQHAERASAAGHFFRGMALTRSDPIAADASFERAIIQKANFTQAWLQQARAIDQIMYLLGGIEYYDKGVARLEAAINLDRTNAYAWYLLSNAHRLAAEELTRRGDTERARTIFDAALRAARAAQTADPTSSRGFAAQAAYHESQGQYREAIEAWNALDGPGLRLTNTERSERYVYQMRLHYWLRECDAAEDLRKQRYSEKSGYDPAAGGYDADEALFGALIAKSAGDETKAEETARDALAKAGTDPKNLLLVLATHEFLGIPPEPGAATPAAPASAALPPNWTPDYAAALLSFQRGELDEPELSAKIEAQLAKVDGDARRLARPFLMAPLHFHAGVRAWARQDRNAAIERFAQAAAAHDDENYCFNAAFLLGRLRAEAGAARPNSPNPAISP